MDILFKMKHFANRTLLTFLGPADLDENNDPRVLLKREYAERFPKSDSSDMRAAEIQQPVAVPATPAVGQLPTQHAELPKAVA